VADLLLMDSRLTEDVEIVDLQSRYDLEIEKDRLGPALGDIQPLAPRAYGSPGLRHTSPGSRPIAGPGLDVDRAHRVKACIFARLRSSAAKG
jgi:hypothetical protein